MAEKRAFADLVAAACQNAGKQLQPPVSFCPDQSYHRKMAQALRGEILRAKRYILDDDVTEAAVDLGMQHPEILLAVLKNAMAPFDSMWIEWSPQAQMNASMNNTGLPEGWLAAGGPPAGNCGVLLKRVGDTAYRITMIGQCLLDTSASPGLSSYHMYGVAPLSIYYDIHSPVYGGQGSPAEQMVVRHTDWNMDQVRSALLAGAYFMPETLKQELVADLKAEADEDETVSAEQIDSLYLDVMTTRMRQCDTLASHAMWTFDPIFGKPYQQRLALGPNPFDKNDAQSRYFNFATETLGLEIQEEAGIFRFVIAVIALMVGRDRLAAEFPAGRDKKQSKFHRGRTVPFLENRRVSLTVPRKIANRRIVRSLYKSMPRAQHDVEGHWKQRRKGYDVNCEHVMVWETPKREVCAIEGCGFKRWRVEEFKRGDASIGVIKKTRVAELDRKVRPLPAIVDNAA
jgi:hypothetical protein